MAWQAAETHPMQDQLAGESQLMDIDHSCHARACVLLKVPLAGQHAGQLRRSVDQSKLSRLDGFQAFAKRTVDMSGKKPRSGVFPVEIKLN